MLETRRTNQGGSIASFIVIGVILVVGLLGAMYYLNQRNEQVRKEQEVAESKKQQTDKESSKPTNSNKSSNNPAVAASATHSSSSDIPTTGPEAVITEISGLFLLSTSTTGYVLSRRKLIRSL